MARRTAGRPGPGAHSGQDRARNPGDVRPVGAGVSELRIDYGPGYRVYFKQRGQELVILLAGGDKRTQARDIRTALRLAHDLLE